MSNPSEENYDDYPDAAAADVPEVAAAPYDEDADTLAGEYVDDPMVAEEDK